MSSAGAVSIQSARLSQIGVNRQVLKEGSSVLVRVIADRGNGKYEGSVAGVRVQLTSAKPLRAGNEISESQLLSLLESLGLPADNLSSTILQSFKQMGLKMDTALANKIRSLALRFGGKEKSAAEILSLLAQKGIEADEAEIKELLSLLEREENQVVEGRTKQKPESADKEKTKEKLISRINSTEGSWYLLPFELVELSGHTEDGRLILGGGCIRLLFDSSAALKMLNLDCKYNNQQYLFSLMYEDKRISNTYFNVSSADRALNFEEEIINLKKHFMAAGINPGKITWAEKPELEGNASGLESFVSFGGEI